MPRSVLSKTLWDRRRSFAWWTLGLVGLVALMTAVYPTIRDNPEMNRLVDEYPEALKAFIAFGGAVDYTSGAGYLGSELFSLMIPLLFIVCSVGNGAGAVAGEEERGTLDLLLSTPVTRRRVAVEKIAAMALELFGLVLVLCAALWVGAAAVGMDDVSAAQLAAATTSAGLLALAFGAIAFLVGAATGPSAQANRVATAGAVAAYLVNGLAALVEILEIPQKLSPFYHYAIGDPLRQGLALDHSLVLVAITLAAAAAGVIAFERRDLASS
jgi:ABC-2 type transport system permease protein